jgi:hypothetical protein
MRFLILLDKTRSKFAYGKPSPCGRVDEERELSMKTTEQPIHFAGTTLGKHRHSCALFYTDDQEYRVLLPFIKEGIVQLERRPGKRFVSEVVEINRYDPDLDEYDFGVIFRARQEEP